MENLSKMQVLRSTCTVHTNCKATRRSALHSTHRRRNPAILRITAATQAQEKAVTQPFWVSRTPENSHWLLPLANDCAL